MIYNLYNSIGLPFGEENRYFLQLFQSLLRVDKKYIEYEVDFTPYREGYVPHLERVFAYELYRQWGNRLELEHEPLQLNAEIKKVIDGDFVICFVDNQDEEIEERKITLYPDLVLHHSQGDNNSQIMICEIKRFISLNNNKSSKLIGSAIFGDIYKIYNYMKKLDFKYGIFMLTNGSLKDVVDKVRNDVKIKIEQGQRTLEFSQFLKTPESRSVFNRIVCVAYNGKELEYETLDKLFMDKITELNKEAIL